MTTFYHKNNLTTANRRAYFDTFYSQYYTLHSKLESSMYDGSTVIEAIGELLAWLENLADIEKIPNGSIDQIFYYIVDATLHIAYAVNVSDVDIENTISIVNERITELSYVIEAHHDEYKEHVSECFAKIAVHFAKFSHLQIASCIAFMVTDFTRSSVARQPGREPFYIIIDVLATIKWVANKVSLERKNGDDLSNLFSGASKKDRNSI